MISWIFNSITLNLFDTGSFIWGITFHNLKYLDHIILDYILKSDIFSTYINFDEKCFFGYFKSQVSKCPNHIRILPFVLGHRKPSVQFNKLVKVSILMVGRLIFTYIDHIHQEVIGMDVIIFDSWLYIFIFVFVFGARKRFEFPKSWTFFQSNLFPSTDWSGSQPVLVFRS